MFILVLTLLLPVIHSKEKKIKKKERIYQWKLTWINNITGGVDQLEGEKAHQHQLHKTHSLVCGGTPKNITYVKDRNQNHLGGSHTSIGNRGKEIGKKRKLIGWFELYTSKIYFSKKINYFLHILLAHFGCQ